jgi:hypothetical protein
MREGRPDREALDPPDTYHSHRQDTNFCSLRASSMGGKAVLEIVTGLGNSVLLT